MPQDQATGADGNTFGRQTAREIAHKIGAQMLNRTSNEAVFNGNRVVIKCAGLTTPNIGVTYNMINRLHSIIGAFQQSDGAFELFVLPVENFKNNMKDTKSLGASAGKVGVLSKKVFIDNGIELKTVRIIR